MIQNNCSASLITKNISIIFKVKNSHFRFVSKRIFILIISTCISFIVNAQVSKSVIATAGALSSVLTAEELNTITNLTITGNIDARDFKTMRDSMPLLAALDLTDVTITAYSGANGTYFLGNYDYPGNEIPYSAFYDSNSVGKTSLTSVVLPKSSISIGQFAFRGCIGLRSFIMPDQIISIGNYAFGSCRSLTSFVIPEGTISIGVFVFESCSGLTSITIPSTVSSIGEGAFMSFSGTINVVQGNHSYSSINGILFNKAQTVLLQCPISKTGKYIIPESVTSIGNYAFYSCNSLTSITVPPLVNTIGKEAFARCTGITSLTIPAAVISIGSQALWGCGNLINITTRNSIPLTFGSSFEVFGEVNKSTCYLNVPYGTVTLFHNADQWKDFINIIEIPDLILSANTANIESAAESTAKIDINSGIFWSAISDQSWLTINPSSGIGNQTITLKAEANSLLTPRTANITVSANGSESQTITVTQNAKPGLPIDSGDSTNFGNWSDETWNNRNLIKNWNFNNGLSNWGYWADLYVKGQENHQVVDGIISMKTGIPDDGDPKHYILQQSGIKVEPNTAYTIKFKSWSEINRINTFNFHDSWENELTYCGVSADSSSIDGRSRWEYNTSPESKWFTFHLVFDQIKPTTNVTIDWWLSTEKGAIFMDSVILVKDSDLSLEDPKYLTISSTKLNITDKESNSIINITSNTEWAISTDQNWLTINPSSGSGNKEIILAAHTNLLNTNRSATITFSSPYAESKILTVVQDKAEELPNEQIPITHIKKTNVAPILDGFIDDVWSNATENNIAVPFRTETPTLGNQGETTWKALWDDNGIYVLIKVADDVFSPVYEGSDLSSWWMYDKTELYFDCNPIKKDGKGTTESFNGIGNGHQCFYSTPIINSINGNVVSQDYYANGSYFSYKVSGSQYVVEQFIPFSRLTDQNGAVVDKFQPIGFDVTVVDNDGKTPLRNRMNWANAGDKDECWNNMDDAGLIQLDPGNSTEQIPITKITLSPGSISTENGTLQLNTYIEPENATNKKLSWSVINNTGSASASETGLVTAISNGTVTVIARSMDSGQIEGSANVEISGQKTENNNEGPGLTTYKVGIGYGKGEMQVSIMSIPNSPVSSDQSWLRVEPTTGSGEQQVRMVFDSNPTTYTRTAAVTILEGGKASKLLIVIQDGKSELPTNTGNSDFGKKWNDEIWNNKNLIKNWNFSNGFSEWIYLVEPSVLNQLNPIIQDGAISMKTGLPEDNQKWHYMLWQSGLKAEANVAYTLKFKSWSSTPRLNNIAFEDNFDNNYNRYGTSADPGAINNRSDWNYSITNEPKWFTFHVVFDQIHPNSVQKILWMLATDDGTAFMDSIILVKDADLQLNSDYNLALSTSIVKLTGTESNATVDIISNVNWTVSCNQSWLSLNLTSGSGNSPLFITASANTETTPRNATITVSAEGGITKTITISQDGKIDTGNSGNSFLPITYMYVLAKSSSVNVDINPDLNWEVTSDQSWINVSPELGTGQQTLSLILDANPSYIPRTGSVIVFDAGIASQLIIVTQDGIELLQGDSENNVYYKKINITGKESKALINIPSAPTSVNSDQSWLTATPNESDDKTLSFTIEPNPTNESRTAIVTVYSNGEVTQTIKITQEAGNETTGITPVNNEAKLVIYPNPTSGKIKLKLAQLPKRGVQLTIFDLKGKTILHQYIQEQEQWIDLKGNSPGVYFIKTDQGNQTTQKLILK